MLVALVVFGEFLVRYAKFLRQAMESVSLAYLYIIVTIEGMYGMKIVACRIVFIMPPILKDLRFSAYFSPSALRVLPQTAKPLTDTGN